jgi:hypothetical protein
MLERMNAKVSAAAARSTKLADDDQRRVPPPPPPGPPPADAETEVSRAGRSRVPAADSERERMPDEDEKVRIVKRLRPCRRFAPDCT